MKSAFEAAEQYFEEAAAVMNLTSSMRELLLIPEREVKVQGGVVKVDWTFTRGRSSR